MFTDDRDTQPEAPDQHLPDGVIIQSTFLVTTQHHRGAVTILANSFIEDKG
jgi:hypothetical protein